MNTPPIVCQQSFLNWLEADDDGLQLEAPEDSFKDLMRLIASFFDLDLGDAVHDVEVTTVADLTFLRRLQKRGDFSDWDMRKIRSQIVRSESYYIPRAQMVYLGNLSVNHASEEATHFIRHVLAQCHEPRLLVDAFYWRVLEEAVGFLGSKIINHKRKCPPLAFFRRVVGSRNSTRNEKQLARLVLKHEKIISGRKVRGVRDVYECNATLFNELTHIIGYQLGDKLYYGLIDGLVDKGETRQLFFERFEREGDALTTYLYLVSRTAKVRLPERF